MTSPGAVVRRGRRLLPTVDLAVGYLLLVIMVSVLVAIQPPDLLRLLVQQSSTNLTNLRARPLAVLVLSAFVVSPVWQLVLVVPAAVAYGILQRWLGRLGLLVVMIFGHVGATLCVATIEVTALYRHLARFDVVIRPDVGISYGLAAAVGVLVAWVPVRRGWYAFGSTVVIIGQALVLRNFTALGHVVAWLIGLLLAALISAVSAGPSISEGPARPRPGT